MTPLTSKVCIVGDFAVGKTSTVERFVNQEFSEKYLTTVGVKIDTKEVELTERGIVQKLVLWDVAGKDRFGDIELAYLRGASGVIYVADGTRARTISVAQELREQIESRYGEQPYVFLLNKFDLTSTWEVSEKQLQMLKDDVGNLFVTSAKTGSSVNDALISLAGTICDRELFSDS